MRSHWENTSNDKIWNYETDVVPAFLVALRKDLDISEKFQKVSGEYIDN